MSGGGGGNTTTTQKADPWSGIQPYLTTGYENLQNAANNIPTYYPGQTYAGFDPAQTQSQNLALTYAQSPEFQNGLSNGLSAMNYGLNSVYDPYSNPAIQSYTDAAIRPLTQAYQQNVNQNASNAVASGGLGGSRQGVADALSARDYMNAVGDTSAGIYNNAYNQGLTQQARMAALMPQTMSLGLMPSQIYGDVGSQRQGMAQNQINEDINRYNFNQTAPYDRYSSYLSTLQGTPWSSSSMTGPDPNASSTTGQLLGAGMLGLGAYSALGAASPYAIPAALAMGGLSLF